MVETESKIIHLNQHKLYTLFSISFQYLLFKSTKEHGHYIIRVEDSLLASKLTRKAKDETTRKFMNSLAIPRKLKYGNSTFHLDFFNVSTWAITGQIPQDKIKGVLIVKNASDSPLMEPDLQLDLPQNYYLESILSAPKIVIIDFKNTYSDSTIVRFPFIKDKKEEAVNGVRISADIDINSIDD